MRRVAAVVVLSLVLTSTGGCSIRRLAINSLADSLARSGDLFASDEDPELVRDATPFGLKTIEGLLAEVPDHAGLLLTACQGFTQYSYAFVETDAVLLESADYRESRRLRERALRLYLRARDYCLRGLELEHPGITDHLKRSPEEAAAGLKQDELALLFWTGASWGGAISLAPDRPELVADTSAVTALMRRALEIDEGFDRGAIHAVLIALESLPEAMGGSQERARRHFDRAVELSGGLSAGPYVTLAAGVSVANQDREEFERLLGQALEIDPDDNPGMRLQNLIVQQRARHLLAEVDELILGPDPGEGSEP